jgi:DNA-binding transcriptional ArsR family regulator
MDITAAVAVLSGLAQDTRLATFRLLVRHEPVGIPAGEIAQRLGVPQNTMSAHLATLTRAGLLTSERRGRSIVYRADLDRFRELTVFLVKDCCSGRPELCGPLIEELAPCC